jgi:topoisomerase IV subunit A
MQEIIKRIYDYSLEEIMGERFGRYSKTIIQDRALPDVRDGLKPVQRRILYTMYKDKNTHDKAYRKSAKTVGNVMASYHPHGDSSIYEAMVRMSQWWKQSTIYVDMHGNNGSMDGDSPAAMRYTEARLSKISSELLKDLDRDTVVWAPNYDDTAFEPTVLPAKFPNLLVNGSTGISAGYATNIPTHNLGEIIEATIKRIDSPNCYLDTILDIVKGPDFSTGGIVEGIEGIKEAYKTGRGKIIIRSKVSFDKTKGKDQIIIEEIPFEVNKATLVKRIDEIRMDKKIEGIQEVRDESDRDGLRIAIDLKKDVDKDLILNYLYKNTDMQVSYSFNMVAIVNRRPITLGIIEIIDAYIAHQKEVITKRTEYDLNFAKERLHIVEGLIKMISIIDQVIATIRRSENKANAIVNLINDFKFTEKQANAIVSLQLYRLTNTDVALLEEEMNNLLRSIHLLETILNNEETLKGVMKDELRKIKKEYAIERKTVIKNDILDIKIDTTLMIPKEDVVVVVTKEGYVKRVPLKSYASNNEDTLLKEQDYVIGLYNMNTLDTLLLFTDLGNYLYVPVHELPDLKWKEIGKHISNIIKLEPDENIIFSAPVYSFDENSFVTLFTKNGMIKRTLISDFKCQRYSKPITSIKLKEKDKVISVDFGINKEVFIVTKNGYGLWFDIEEVPVTGLKTSGVKAINLKNDEVVSATLFNKNMEYVTVITNKNTGKRVKISEFDKSTRSRKGLQIVRDVKTNPYHILKAFVINNKELLGLKFKDEIEYIKTTELSIVDRYSTGNSLSKHNICDVFIKKELEEKTELKEEESIKKEELSLKEIDERIMTIDDFLEEFDR